MSAANCFLCIPPNKTITHCSNHLVDLYPCLSHETGTANNVLQLRRSPSSSLRHEMASANTNSSSSSRDGNIISSNGSISDGNSHLARSDLPPNVTAAIAAARTAALSPSLSAPSASSDRSKDASSTANTPVAASAGNTNSANASKDALALTDFMSKAQLHQFTMPLMRAGVSSLLVLEVNCISDFGPSLHYGRIRLDASYSQ